MHYNTIPAVVYTWPEIASVGLTEHQAKEPGRAYKTGKFPFSANGRARTSGDTSGFVKFIADAKTDELLGAHIIGPNVSRADRRGGAGVRVSRVVGGHRRHRTCAPDAERDDEGSRTRGARPRDAHLTARRSMELALRALMPEDAGAARALIEVRLGGTRYAARAAEMLDAALGFDDPEFMALLAFPEDAPHPSALVLFGTVAGARAVVKVHALLASEPEPAAALLEALRGAGERSAERMLFCELADDAPFVVAAEALAAAGYVEEGRVPDFVADGIALRLLVLRLT